MTPAEAVVLRHTWEFWARPDQVTPDTDWLTWLILTGRGWGKTRTAAEAVRARIESGRWSRTALVGATAGDVREVMVEGESGILAISPPWFRPKYEPSKRRLTWPNGAIATTFSADEPDRLRGPQHDGAWTDEPATWRYLDKSWDNLMLGLRQGPLPQVIATTTPRPLKLIRALLKDPTTFVTRGSTYANRENLAPSFYAKIISQYEGTRLGRQEIQGEVLEDVVGALWTMLLLDELRLQEMPQDASRVVVAVDPPTTSGEESDEAGIIVTARTAGGTGYVLDDCSGQMSPAEWGRAALDAYHKHRADAIVAETNQGGDMVRHVIQSVLRPGEEMPRFIGVHAKVGKRVRAEPVAAMYEQRRIRHVGSFPTLEDQMCNWVPGESDGSPDRMDAAVHGFAELFPAIAASEPVFVVSPGIHERRLAHNPAKTICRGWSFHHRRPACVWAQFDDEWRLCVLRETQGEGQAPDQLGRDALAYFADCGQPIDHAAEGEPASVADPTGHEVLRSLDIYCETQHTDHARRRSMLRRLLAVRADGMPGILIDPATCPLLAEGLRGAYAFEDEDPDRLAREPKAGAYAAVFAALEVLVEQLYDADTMTPHDKIVADYRSGRVQPSKARGIVSVARPRRRQAAWGGRG